MGLRPYQAEAIEAVHVAWQTDRSTLLVMATGTGKTWTAAEILRERAPVGRILWLAHRTELLAQARTTVESGIGLACDLEQAQSYAPHFSVLGSPVVVASVQTLRGARLARWPETAFATIVIDEAHHATAAGYRAILDHFRGCKVLGLTATPDRTDGVAMGHVFGSVAYEYDIRTGISEGYLCPIIQRQIQCADLDISDVETRAGDLAQGELERRMSLEAVLHQIAVPAVEMAGPRPTIIFTAGVDQSNALVDIIARYVPSGSVVSVDGKTEKTLRAKRIGGFLDGSIQFLVNCAVFTEGFDAPLTSCIVMARPTKSRSLYAQMMGRGLRPSPGKENCLVIDCVGNAGRHSLITPLDVLGGKKLPDDVAAMAAKLIVDGAPTEDALAEAERRAAEESEREDRRRRKAGAMRVKLAYRSWIVDPFGALTDAPDAPRASDAQRDYLRNLGVQLTEVPSKREASTILDAISKRRSKGLCTYKQASLLIKNGMSGELSFAAAREAIDALAANKWTASPAMVEKYGAAGDDG